MENEPLGGWVQWSNRFDADGRRMVEISGGYYPQDLAREIAEGILALLAEPRVMDSE